MNILAPGTYTCTHSQQYRILAGGVYHITLTPGPTEPLEITLIVVGRHHDDIHITLHQQHHDAYSRSVSRVCGLVYDRARMTVASLVHIAPSAHRAHAEQAAHIILMSDTARARTQPAVEIGTNDVVCQHASAIGQLDQAAMRYLAERGIEECSARPLLVRALLNRYGIDWAEDLGVDVR